MWNGVKRTRLRCISPLLLCKTFFFFRVALVPTQLLVVWCSEAGSGSEFVHPMRERRGRGRKRGTSVRVCSAVAFGFTYISRRTPFLDTWMLSALFCLLAISLPTPPVGRIRSGRPLDLMNSGVAIGRAGIAFFCLLSVDKYGIC